MLLTTDTFTDSAGTLLENHTGETGAVWTRNPILPTGSAAITADGRLRGNAAATIYFSSGVPSSADYDVEADLIVASNVNNAGLVGRQSATAETYYLFDYENGANFKLYTLVNATNVNSTTYAMTLTAGQTYHLRLSMRGSQIACFVNGVQIIAITDANIPAAGRAGLYFSAQDTDTTGYHLDNFASSTPTTTPVTDGNIFFSPYNWFSDGAGSLGANNVNASSTLARTNTPGAYLKLGLNAAASGNATLLLDTSSLNGITAANCPTIAISVDGGAFTTQLLSYATGTTRLPIAGNLSAGAHSAIVYFRSIDTTSALSMGDRWNTPASAVTVTGVELDGKGSATAAPALRSKRMLFYGDSITEGVDAVGGSGANGDQDATQTYGQLLAAGLDAEVGIVGFAAQGWTIAGYGNVPTFYDVTTPSNSAYDKYFAGASRLHGGALSPAPDYLAVSLGRNDVSFGATDAAVTAAVSAVLPALRTIAPSSHLLVITPIDGSKRGAIAAGFAAANVAGASLIDFGTSIQSSINVGGLNTNDGIHLNVRGHATIASLLLNQLRTILGGAATTNASTGQFAGGSVSLTDGIFATG
jgi:lysophospholipase L1-like esterase